MTHLSHVKWYAEKLCKLLEQDPNCTLALSLYNAVNNFLHTTNIESIEAQAPPGVYEEGNKIN